MVAAGPYSTADNLSYEPMGDLFKYINRDQPDVCILVSFNLDILF